MSAAPGNSQNRQNYQRRSDSPRKVRGGIKLAGTLLNREQDEPAKAAVELGRQFQSLWESAIEVQTWMKGVEYAKAGQIVDLEFRAGIIESHVQGTLAKPYLVQLHVPIFDDSRWARAIGAMSGEAVYVAKLLAGELPAAIHERLKEAGVELLPQSADALSATCTCAAAQSEQRDGGVRCKHVAAAALVASERLADQPLLIFTLLGKSPDHVLEHLRQARAGHAANQSGASQDLILSDISFHAPPLEACIDDFWRSPLPGKEWIQLQEPLGNHYVSHALLRRLGPSPMSGRFPLVGLLASVYDTVAATADNLQKHSESTAVNGTDPTS